MQIEKVKQLPVRERFLYWIRERRQILKKRRAGKPKPWTDDEILQTCYFTNVCREDDRVTIWFRENIREPLRDSPAVVFATIAFRWFNYIPTGESLKAAQFLTRWDVERVVTTLLAKQMDWHQVFTGAFNISNSGSTKPKINRVCEDYIQPVWEQRDNLYRRLTNGTGSMVSTFNILQELPGLGGSGFMAAQVICDLAYTHVLENAPDWWTWCSWGPGSNRGMNRVYDKTVDNRIAPGDWRRQIGDLQYLVEKRLNLKLHARDIQNCLCEFDKYERVLLGEGKSKRRYEGHA